MVRKLQFILLGNKLTGKTTLAKIFSKTKPFTTNPTTNISKYSGKVKLLSSKKSSLFSIERWRKYKVIIIDTPGSFEERRQWRDAFKKTKKPLCIIFMINPYQSIPETQSALEEVYNQYLDSLSLDITKADHYASTNKILLVIIMNDIANKGSFDQEIYYNSNIKNIIDKITEKIPLLTVEIFSINILDKPMPKYLLNSVLERVKKYYY